MNKKSVWWATGVAVVVIAIVLVVALSSRGDDDPDTEPTARPTASASQPVTTPSPTTPAPTTAAPTTRPTGPVASPKPVPIDSPAPIDAGAEARIAGIQAVVSEAEGPGEISRPAIRVTIQITAGSKSVDLTDVVVNGYYGKKLTPAISVAKPGGKPFSGTLAAGKTATGVYVFNVPAKERGNVTIELFFSPTDPPAQFRGSAA